MNIRLKALLVAVTALLGVLPSLAGTSLATATVPHSASATGIPCYPSGGPRVSVFYLYATGQPDDLAFRLPALRDAAAQLDAVVAASAARTGGVRHVKLRTGDDCALVVRSLAVDRADPVANLAQLQKDGLLPVGDTGLAFAGPTLGGFTAGATSPEDDRPDAANVSNAGGQLGVVGFGAWGSVEGPAAVLARALGAVQRTAPHASASGGCTDGADPLCYDDLAIGAPLTSTCPASGRYLLDCGGDDYFSTAPVPGSWLASHWNIADSTFLSDDPPPRADPVEAIGIALEGIPADGRVGPQTPITVRVTNSQPLQEVVLVSSRAPGAQPLAVTGSSATGALRSLASTGPAEIFAVVTDKLGRERISALVPVEHVRGGVLTVGSPSSALRGSVDYRVDLDLSGDQLKATRFLVFRPRVGDVEPIVLADVQVVSGQVTYTGTLDTTKLPDGDGQSIFLVLADAAGDAVPGSQTSLRRSISNVRPLLSLDVRPDEVLQGVRTLTAGVEGAVSAVRFVQTTTDCAAGRVLGTVAAAPYALAYDSAADWRGPGQGWSLCVLAVLPGGSTTTTGPVPVQGTLPDSVELRLPPGSVFTVGLNKVPIIVRAPSNRRLRAVQLLETSPLFGKGGHLVMSTPVTGGTLPTALDLVVAPGAVGRTEVYVRAVFEDGAGEYLRTDAVPVTAVAGPAPTMTFSASTILTGEKVLVSGTAPPGAELRMFAVVRPGTTYTLVRSGTVPLDGKYSALLGPPANARIYTQVLGGGSTAAMPLNVRSAVSLAVTRTALRTYRFSGSVVPKRAGVRVTVARRTPTGGLFLVQTTSGADGRWAVSHRFTANGPVDVLAVASANAVTAQGSSPVRRLVVS